MISETTRYVLRRTRKSGHVSYRTTKSSALMWGTLDQARLFRAKNHAEKADRAPRTHRRPTAPDVGAVYEVVAVACTLATS